MAENHYYNAKDLGKFGEIGRTNPALADKFFGYYNAMMAKEL